MAEPPLNPTATFLPTSSVQVEPSPRLDIRNIMNETHESPVSTPSDTAAKPRKAHRKSRLGCATCKRRRVKCDEVKPVCGNCRKHNAHCDFAGIRPQALGVSPRPPTGFGDDDLETRDMELLHHFTTSTAYSFTTDPMHQEFVRTVLPRIGFKHTFVLRAILTFSALHRARFHESERQRYLDLASHHYNIGLRQATALLPAIDDDNCDAVYLFSMLSCIITLASGPKPGDYIAFGSQGSLMGMHTLSRGMETILQANFERLSTGILAPMVHGSTRVANRLASASPDCESLQTLCDYIADEAPDDGYKEIYISEAEKLQKYFDLIQNSAPNSIHAEGAFNWILMAPEEFKTALAERRQLALCIYAHFCVLFHQTGSFWWVEGWDTHLIAGVWNALDNEHRIWISWPIKQIGWFPPDI